MSKLPYEIELLVREVTNGRKFNGVVWEVYASDDRRACKVEELTAYFQTEDQAWAYVEAMQNNLNHKVRIAKQRQMKLSV